MMTCESLSDLVTRSLSGNASRQDDAELRTHTAACPACAEAQRKLIRAWALMGTHRVEPLASKPPELPARRRILPWRLVGSAAAAAAVLVVIAGLSLDQPVPVPVPIPAPAKPPAVAAKPAPAPAPSPTVPEESPETTVEKERIEAVLAKAEPAPAPVPPPAPIDPKPPSSEPKPAVDPVPPPAPPAPPVPSAPSVPKEAPIVAAVLDEVGGEVTLIQGGARSAAKAGAKLLSGSALETSGRQSQAVLAFEDGTRVVIGADSIVGEISSARSGGNKRVFLQKGVLAAQIAKQPASEPMIFQSPFADARVLGTRLTMSVTGSLARLEVREGRVRFTRREDGASVEVGADQSAAAGKSVTPVVKPLPAARVALREAFEGPRWSGAWATGGDPGQGLRLSVENGALSAKLAAKSSTEIPNAGVPLPPGTSDAQRKALDQAGRLAQLGHKKDLPRGVWLESRAAASWSAETPLRVKARIWSSHPDADRSAWLAIRRGVAQQGLVLERRGDALQLWSEGAAAPMWRKDLPCAQAWEAVELWISKSELVVRREGETLFSGPLPATARPGTISLGVSAKAELSKDGEHRFDDVEVSWVTPAEFETVSR